MPRIDLSKLSEDDLTRALAIAQYALNNPNCRKYVMGWFSMTMEEVDNLRHQLVPVLDPPEEDPYAVHETIEIVHDKVWRCQHGRYGPDSVLANQPFRQLCDCFGAADQEESWQKAIAKYPQAEVIREEQPRPEAHIPEMPPAWFDPSAAGEVWHEEDY